MSVEQIFFLYSNRDATIKQTVIIAKRLTLDNKAPAVHTTPHAVSSHPTMLQHKWKEGFLCVCPPIDVPLSNICSHALRTESSNLIIQHRQIRFFSWSYLYE